MINPTSRRSSSEFHRFAGSSALAALFFCAAFSTARGDTFTPNNLAASSQAQTTLAANNDPSIKVLLSAFRGSHEITLSSAGVLHITRKGSDSTVISDKKLDPGEQVQISSAQVSDQTTSETIIEPKSDDNLTLQPGESLQVTPDSDQSASTESMTPIAITPFGLATKHYRGEMDITALTDGTLQVVNTLGVEEYLLGVVGPEIGSGSPTEALKAQAVAARTYALKNRGKLGKYGADLDDTTACQTYGGVDAERQAVSDAVLATSGQVATYNGALIDAMYGTDCGGMTADGGAPYLAPVADPECATEAAWTFSIPVSDFLLEIGALKGVDILDGIDSISADKTDSSGRVVAIEIGNSKSGQTCDITSNQLRSALGVNKIRSTLFTVSLDQLDGNITFTGHGWGHGIGMCQHGAIEMARANASYVEILAHYYTGSQLAQVSGATLTAAAPILAVRVKVAAQTKPSLQPKPGTAATQTAPTRGPIIAETGEEGQDGVVTPGSIPPDL